LNDPYELIGRKGKIAFPAASAVVDYTSETALHWKTTDSAGIVAEGDEKMDYRRLSDTLHFLNWIEKDGFTVSQIIDTKNKVVTAYWSFADDESPRGGRASSVVTGSFAFHE
jgi:hypothetical protein